MSSTRSPKLMLIFVRSTASCQNSSSFSLVISRNLTLPMIGSVAGCVMTSLPRGKCATVPPKVSCSSVTKRKPVLLGGEAGREAGGPGADDHHVEHRRARRHARADRCRCAWRPCSMALRIRPMPPSSPAM